MVRLGFARKNVNCEVNHWAKVLFIDVSQDVVFMPRVDEYQYTDEKVSVIVSAISDLRLILMVGLSWFREAHI